MLNNYIKRCFSGYSNHRTLSYQVVGCDELSKGGPTYVKQEPVIQSPAFESLPRIEVFPNPAHNRFYVRIDGKVGQGLMLLTDMQGKTLRKERFQPGLQFFNTTGFVTCMYLVIFQTKDGMKTEKLSTE